MFDIQTINSDYNGVKKDKKSKLQRLKTHLNLFVHRRRFSDGKEMFTQAPGHSFYRLVDIFKQRRRLRRYGFVRKDPP